MWPLLTAFSVRPTARYGLVTLSMQPFEKLQRWMALPEAAARAEAAFKLGEYLDAPETHAAALVLLVSLLADPDDEVARVAVGTLASTERTPASALAAGLQSAHPAVRTACLDALDKMDLGWNELCELGLEVSLVHTERLIAAIVESAAWRDVAVAEILRRDLESQTVAELRTLRTALEGTGAAQPRVDAVLDAKRRAAVDNRRPPAAGDTKHLSELVRDITEGNRDGADDYVYMLSDGDWARLPFAFEGMSPEEQEELLDVVGHGPPRGLFFLLEQLAGRE